MNKRQRKKAVAVARDVIKQLRVDRFLATPGSYCNIEYNSSSSGHYEYFSDFHEDADSFQEAFATDEKIVCHVCAMGALYVGFINRFNNVSNGDTAFAEDDEIIDILSGVFSEDQLRLMECVFENSWIVEPPDWYLDMSGDEQDHFNSRRAVYHGRYKNANDLLRVIMLNVIRNDGEFVLPKRIK